MSLIEQEQKLKIVLQQLDIVIAAINLKPGILTTDFLEYAAVIPGAWELARPAFNSESFSSIDFANGLSIKADQNRLLLT
ncbi:hypothetical protein NIES4071_02150 [Calothrix sp. NIES-4071]|nr:hypothetical protein NIES4071_02150 [Calothrix sp. NIES-4071]BAZ54561.1 hypothetical protein NIES4105_02140 [Calothrix sp. NIES-4105]